MSELHLPVIDKTIHKTRLWLDDVMAATESMDRARAYRALRAVLHALRDNLDVETGAHFAAQMPLLVRGMYYEGWRPRPLVAPVSTVGAFTRQVAAEFGDFPTLDLEYLCRRVFRVVCHYVSAGEMAEVVQALSPDVRDFLLAAEYRERGETVI